MAIPEFQTNEGWFHRFQDCFALNSICWCGKSVLTNSVAAQQYLAKFKDHINVSNYHSQLAFNECKTGQFYKKQDGEEAARFQSFQRQANSSSIGNAAGNF